MGLLTKAANRLQYIANVLENPQIINLQRRGGSLYKFVSLNQSWITSLGIETILDIGAHSGISTLTFHAVFPNARIYAFEPLPECFQQLSKRVESMPNVQGFNIALGDECTEKMIEANDFTPSSSLLKMTELHKSEFPKTANSKKLSVHVEKLDTITKNLEITSPLLVKIDVQGYEDRVIRGGKSIIRKAQIVILETSFKELYESQPLFDDIYGMMKDLGFYYAGSLEQLNSRKSGYALQEDSIFISF